MSNQPRRPRRHHKPEQKAVLLRGHLVDKVPVSQICEDNELQPSVFYDWLRQLIERAPAALAAPRGPQGQVANVLVSKIRANGVPCSL
jgi:transposase-like protein